MGEKVAFLGLGVMGYPMAGWLSRKGHDVTVFNRTAAKAQAWVNEHGGKTAATPAAAAQAADFVFTCVGDDPDLRSVVLGTNGALAAMPKGAVFVDHTTASAGVAREIAAAGDKRGIACLDAPVSGGQAGAQNAKLTVMVGADPWHRASWPGGIWVLKSSSASAGLLADGVAAVGNQSGQNPGLSVRTAPAGMFTAHSPPPTMSMRCARGLAAFSCSLISIPPQHVPVHPPPGHHLPRHFRSDRMPARG